jgi:hypothetical protein
MILKYDISISKDAISASFSRIVNQIYKLLPMREEGADWQNFLYTIIEELKGLQRLMFKEEEEIFCSLISKLEGLFVLLEEKDFFLFRRTIFDCINLTNVLKEGVEKYAL